MAQTDDIRPHMEVLDSAGTRIGTVDGVEGDRIKLTRTGSADGAHHYVSLSAVSRVDARVHLAETAAALGLAALAAGGPQSAVGDGPLPAILNRAVPGARPRGNFYLPWIVGIVGLILLILLFRSCTQSTTDTTATTTTATTNTTATQDEPTVAGVSGLSGYLSGTDPAPATFAFEKVHFDTAKSELRPSDQIEVGQVATVLKRYPSATIRVAGYADDRGASAANDKLGRARAEAVKAGLVAGGVDVGRIEAVSGGEGDPVDSNATASGRAENRRTELVVVTR